MQHTQRALSRLVPWTLLLGATSAQTFLGPIPYLSAADRPAGFLDGPANLEDFEDGSLDFGLVLTAGTIVMPASNADSVDADDGVIDGLGNDGHSYFGFGPIEITFPSPVTEAGVVWTDGPVGTEVTFEAFGPGMVSLGSIGPFSHSDGNNNGGTGEDRLYGILHAGGIIAIRLHSISGNQSIELDHIQFTSLGTRYCSANHNSAGLIGTQSVLGSPVVADNHTTLVATNLPSNQFGYFIASQSQGFAPNVGGSQGNLCLSGTISRFNSGIFQSGASGAGSLAIDLNQVPSPTGPIAIQAGESWHFQAWHRDLVGGNPTSNFTDGVRVTYL